MQPPRRLRARGRSGDRLRHESLVDLALPSTRPLPVQQPSDGCDGTGCGQPCDQISNGWDGLSCRREQRSDLANHASRSAGAGCLVGHRLSGHDFAILGPSLCLHASHIGDGGADRSHRDGLASRQDVVHSEGPAFPEAAEGAQGTQKAHPQRADLGDKRVMIGMRADGRQRGLAEHAIDLHATQRRLEPHDGAGRAAVHGAVEHGHVDAGWELVAVHLIPVLGLVNLGDLGV